MTSLAVISPSDQEHWHAFYKAAPLVIILLYMRTRGDRPVTQKEIAENFQISRTTAAAAMRKLANDRAIVMVDRNNGYMLAEGGKQMLLQLDDPVRCTEVNHLSLKESLKNDFKDLKDMKERKRQMLKTCASSQILSETGRLWPGHQVTSFGIDPNVDPEYVLAWVAQADDQHRAGRVSWPWALVYRRLQANRTLPDKKYQDDPFQFLPNDYLAALGLADPEPEVIEFESDIVRVKECRTSVDAEVFNAWMGIQEQLRQELRKAEFETWVLGTIPICYADRLLSVGCRNVYAADWLRTHLTNRVQPLLARILGDAQLQVDFIVSTETE